MTEDSPGFLSRWSRRKQEAARGPAAPAQPLPIDPEPGAGPPVQQQPVLPDLASLGAGSDYAAFVQKGVAAAVQQAALQRAWTSDTGIAGFRGMAEYDWDFNAVGYGRLAAGDNVAKLLRAVLSPALDEPEPAKTLGAPRPAQPGETDPVASADSSPVRVTADLPPPAVTPPAAPPEAVAAAVEPSALPARHGSARPT